mgnify:CR=1 FL=1|jgi:ABC-type lipoprotein export system ATPase subunit|tara:strand:- start:40 stop:699 length:660 start_codon:yes stop_codon:yes gene_type:complete
MTLSISNLTIEYPEASVFVDVNLQIEPHELVAVRSEVLDGGTSLLKGIAGFLNGVQGKVLLQGIDLLDNPPTDVIYRIGYVYEALGLVSLFNVRENIALPLLFHSSLSESEIEARVDAVGERFGLNESIYHLKPHQLNDVQTRLVNMARALVVRPKLLLVDELEGGMSDDYLRDTIDAIREHQQQYPMPVIMTTMSDEIFDRADRVYRIADRNLVQGAA